MKHAIEVGWRWDALVLFDPPNVPPPGHPAYPAMEVFEKRLTAWARQRRRRFASIDELAEEYRQSRATLRWVEGAHELMARSVLRNSPDGDGYELVCDPENEATIYAQAMTMNLWPKARRVRRPGQADRLRPEHERRAGDRSRPMRRSAARAATITASSKAPVTCLQIEKPDDCVRLTLDFSPDAVSPKATDKDRSAAYRYAAAV